MTDQAETANLFCETSFNELFQWITEFIGDCNCFSSCSTCSILKQICGEISQWQHCWNDARRNGGCWPVQIQIGPFTEAVSFVADYSVVNVTIYVTVYTARMIYRNLLMSQKLKKASNYSHKNKGKLHSFLRCVCTITIKFPFIQGSKLNNRFFLDVIVFTVMHQYRRAGCTSIGEQGVCEIASLVCIEGSIPKIQLKSFWKLLEEQQFKNLGCVKAWTVLLLRKSSKNFCWMSLSSISLLKFVKLISAVNGR